MLRALANLMRPGSGVPGSAGASPHRSNSGSGTRGSVVTPERVRRAIQNRFNPIRDFTPEKLANQLDAFHAGFLRDAARTWDAMERRDVYLRNVISKRKKSVARLSWEILTVDDSAEAKGQAEALEAFYNQISVTSALRQDEQGGLALLIRQMMDAVGKEFSVHEIVWRPSPEGLSAEFRHCPLWWFENRTGNLRFLPEESAADGTEMAPGEWLVTVGEGLMECSSIAYVFKHLPLKDWLSFSEKFGVPGLLGKTNADKDSDEWRAMEDAVGSFISDWAAVCSANNAIEIVEVKGGSQNLPFPALVDYCDRAIAAVWRGADLSTISKGDQAVGASLQGDETDLLLEDDAELISETLNERVDRFALRLMFGPEVEPLAYIKLQGRASKEEQSFKRDVFKAFITDGTVVDVMANLTDLKELVASVGLPVNREYTDPYLPVKDQQGNLVTGETLRDGEGDVIGALPQAAQTTTQTAAAPDGKQATVGGALGNSRKGSAGASPHQIPPQNSRLMGRSRQEFARATQVAFKPVAERLQRIFALSNETQMRMELNQLLADWPTLKDAVTGGRGQGPGNAKVLAEAMGAALVNGLSSKEEK